MSECNEDGSMIHPAYFLRCTKMVDGNLVVTGWAPNIEAAGKHAAAVGGNVFVHDKSGTEVASFADPYPRQVDLVGHSMSPGDEDSLAS